MEIIINGDIIDTSTANIAVTKDAYDFSDLTKRFLGRTNRFSLPKTALNKSVFESPRIVNSGGRGFEKVYGCSVNDQGATVLRGNGFLEQAGNDYKFQVVDRAKDLFELDKVDVFGFDPSKLVYIEELKSYFIVLNITNYIPGRLTTCELLKVE